MENFLIKTHKANITIRNGADTTITLVSGVDPSFAPLDNIKFSDISDLTKFELDSPINIAGKISYCGKATISKSSTNGNEYEKITLGVNTNGKNVSISLQKIKYYFFFHEILFL